MTAKPKPKKRRRKLKVCRLYDDDGNLIPSLQRARTLWKALDAPGTNVIELFPKKD